MLDYCVTMQKAIWEERLCGPPGQAERSGAGPLALVTQTQASR